MRRKKLNNLIKKLNKLRGIKKRKKRFHNKSKELESPIGNVKFILSRHKLFLNFKPLSPISSPKESNFQQYLQNNSNTPSVLKPIIATHNSHDKPSIFIKNYEKTESYNSGHVKTPVFLEDPRFSSKSVLYRNFSKNSSQNEKQTLCCDVHNEFQPTKPCIQCFFKNYFHTDLC